METEKMLKDEREGTPRLLSWLVKYRGWGFTFNNISTRREVVEFRWDTQNTQTLPCWEYWEYMGWKGTERQCGNGPHNSVLMNINNLEIRSLFTKLSLGITLVVWIRESGSNSYQEKTRSGKKKHRLNDRGETPSATLTNSKRSCKQTKQPLPTKEAAKLGSREGPRRVYSFRAPLRGERSVRGLTESSS